MSRAIHSEYTALYVSVQRLRRQQRRADDAWTHWYRRVQLAIRHNRPELAEAAQRQALIAGETVVIVNDTLAQQEGALLRLEQVLQQ